MKGTTQAPQIEVAPVADLIPYARNSRRHSPDQIAQLAASIDEWGMVGAIIVRRGTIAKGHGTLAAIGKLYAAGKQVYPAPGRAADPELQPYPPGMVPVLRADRWSDAQFRAYVIADNKLALNAGWDEELLRLELADLAEDEFDLTLTGFTLDEIAGLNDTGGGPGGSAASLAERFMLPPFTVFNAREGWWQDRKRAWLSLGIKSELGRGAVAYDSQGSLNAIAGQRRPTAAPGGSNMVAGYAGGKRQVGLVSESGTSVFDPVLCEIAYRWFCPPGGLVLDPFAGGSVRGIVAAKLDRRYTGVELRAEQVAANREQAAAICQGWQYPPGWLHGDSRAIGDLCKDVRADFLFTCPPYADLEVYSDDPADLSTLGYDDFRAAYRQIIAAAAQQLLPDRFACIVVGEVRDKRGHYVNFVGDTVEAFRAAGLQFYNEAILVTAVGSLPIRAAKQFVASRKLGKTHQNVLVFCKGDGKRAAKACGTVEIAQELLQPDADQQDASGEG